jgi:23S rRNA (cytidine2498-2'-O)-methyltransferase
MRLAEDFDLGSVLARTSGFCLGKVRATVAESAVREAWELAGDEPYQQLHVWQRDLAVPGERGFEPGTTPLAEEIGRILAGTPPRRAESAPSLPVNGLARRGDRVLDCVLVEPNEWWLGWHIAAAPPSCWPGGVPLIDQQSEVISRAYYKLHEALAWSRLPLRAGDCCAEIGCAPGGAAQALLERGLFVVGIDPAEVDELVREHPHFRHLRKRVAMVKRREFRDVKWLIVDANIAPKNTLDDVEAIVTHRDVHVRGMIVTLKLSDWKGLGSLPAYVERVGGWGFDDVITRQLAFNRQEICLAARRRSRAGRRTRVSEPA